MANTVNLTAETGANFIGDDSTASLTLENSSTGAALNVETPATSSASATFYSGRGTTIGAVTVAPLKLIASGVSAAILEVSGNAFISCTSGGTVDHAVRVKVGNSYYYLGLMSTIDGAAAI